MDDGPFTPGKYPGLSPEACAILNTPVEKCPPEILRIVLTGLAQHIAENLPPELGLSDPQALFATLWGRLAEPHDETAPDAAPDAQPDASPAAPAEAQQNAPLSPPGNRPEAQAPTPPNNADGAAAAATPNPTVPRQPGRDRRRPPRHARHQLRRRTVAGGTWHKTWQTLPPPPRPYHACAGPP